MSVNSSSGGPDQFGHEQIDCATFAKLSKASRAVGHGSVDCAKNIKAVASTEFPYSLRDLSLVFYSRLEPGERDADSHAQVRISESEGALVASGSEPVKLGPASKGPEISRMVVDLERFNLPTPGTYTAEVILGDRVIQSNKLYAVYLD